MQNPQPIRLLSVHQRWSRQAPPLYRLDDRCVEAPGQNLGPVQELLAMKAFFLPWSRKWVKKW